MYHKNFKSNSSERSSDNIKIVFDEHVLRVKEIPLSSQALPSLKG
jgi:hypothetical protein